jgi:carbon storage regulator
MLVLSRQVDETIMIGDDIEVTVVDIRGDKVRLGITAPKEIAVHRKEVYEAIKRENRDAARVKPEDLPHIGKLGNQQQPGPRPPSNGGGHGGGHGGNGGQGGYPPSNQNPPRDPYKK